MREHFSHPGGMVSMTGCVIDGAIGPDQNGELVAVDGRNGKILSNSAWLKATWYIASGCGLIGLT